MSSIDPFRNRLQKNFRHWRKWARRREISCFRIYDRDIPEFPLGIDWYEGHVHIQEFAAKGSQSQDSPFTETDRLVSAISDTLEVTPDRLAFKTRQRQKGLAQYEKLQQDTNDFVVHEGGLSFLVNLDAYLDTGLFLDHRQTRAMIREQAAGRRVLNLFAYTGSFTVYAADGNCTESITVDMSNTYQEWTRNNLQLNGMSVVRHKTVRADVFKFLQQAATAGERFDLIVMDPPSFSNSKKMSCVLDIQRDHAILIRRCLEIMAPDSELYFSTNLRRFKLNPELQKQARIEDISRLTIPDDFKRHRPHQCWRISLDNYR